jgi:hypothetical protein
MKVWTLTTDGLDGIQTTVHRSAEEALATVFANVDGEYGDDLQALLDGEGIVVYIDEHEV